MIRRLLERLGLRRRKSYRDEILADEPFAYWPLNEWRDDEPIGYFPRPRTPFHEGVRFLVKRPGEPARTYRVAAPPRTEKDGTVTVALERDESPRQP